MGLRSGDKESAADWREFFRDLKMRGLDASKVILGVMDGLSGLETVFKEEFLQSKVQRCHVHVARNVFAKVPKKLKEAVADDLRALFYAPSRQNALESFEHFKSKWSKERPSAVSTLERSIDACLTFFDFPIDEWLSLRTTSIIERLNKEFKRRTKTMAILAGEAACYRLLGFISLKIYIGGQTPSEKCGRIFPSSSNWPIRNLHKKVNSTFFKRSSL